MLLSSQVMKLHINIPTEITEKPFSGYSICLWTGCTCLQKMLQPPLGVSIEGVTLEILPVRGCCCGNARNCTLFWWGCCAHVFKILVEVFSHERGGQWKWWKSTVTAPYCTYVWDKAVIAPSVEYRLSGVSGTVLLSASWSSLYVLPALYARVNPAFYQHVMFTKRISELVRTARVNVLCKESNTFCKNHKHEATFMEIFGTGSLNLHLALRAGRVWFLQLLQLCDDLTEGNSLHSRDISLYKNSLGVIILLTTQRPRSDQQLETTCIRTLTLQSIYCKSLSVT